MDKVVGLYKRWGAFTTTILNKGITLLESKPHEWTPFWRKVYLCTFPLSPLISVSLGVLLFLILFFIFVIGGAILTIFDHISKVANGGEDQHG